MTVWRRVATEFLSGFEGSSQRRGAVTVTVCQLCRWIVRATADATARTSLATVGRGTPSNSSSGSGKLCCCRRCCCRMVLFAIFRSCVRSHTLDAAHISGGFDMQTDI